MARRSVDQWNKLSAAQRARYEGAGRTGRLTGEPFLTPAEVRSYYLSGGDLGGGRGYHAPKNAAPREATRRSSIGTATDIEQRQLETWRRNRAPAWLPKSQAVMGNDTAALLSTIGLQPQNWKNLTVRPAGNGRFIMTVESKRSTRVAKILLPDRTAVVEVRDLFNAQARAAAAPTAAERKRLEKYWTDRQGNPISFPVDIQGTDTRAYDDNKPVPTKKTGQALPNRKRKKK